MTTGLPFDDIRALFAKMPIADLVSRDAARAHESQLTKPPGALGKLENISEWMATWQATHPPRAERVVVAFNKVFGGHINRRRAAADGQTDVCAAFARNGDIDAHRSLLKSLADRAYLVISDG